MARGKVQIKIEEGTTTSETVVGMGARPEGWSKAKRTRRRKTLQEKIETAVQASELQEQRLERSNEMTIKKTGQICHTMPWQAASPCPWLPGYTRVVIPLKEALRNGARCLIQIVRNDNLAHGRIY
jgi:hypothetical protein